MSAYHMIVFKMEKETESYIMIFFSSLNGSRTGNGLAVVTSEYSSLDESVCFRGSGIRGGFDSRYSDSPYVEISPQYIFETPCRNTGCFVI